MIRTVLGKMIPVPQLDIIHRESIGWGICVSGRSSGSCVSGRNSLPYTSKLS